MTVHEMLLARNFGLVDDRGKLRAVLQMSEDGPMLGLRDGDGTLRALLSIGEDGPLLQLTNSAETPQVIIGVNETGAFAGFRDSRETVRVKLGTNDEETALEVYDANGRMRSNLKLAADGQCMMGFLHPSGEMQMSLGLPDTGPSVWIGDIQGKLRARFGLLDQEPQLSLFDIDGDVLTELP